MGNIVENPINSKFDFLLEEEFESEFIIDLYKNNKNIDISRFFEGIKVVSLNRCLKTGYRFFHPFNLMGDGIFYKDLDGRVENYYHDRWEFDLAKKEILIGSDVLEVGSGSGRFLDIISSNVKSVSSLELNPDSILQLKEKGYNVFQESIESHLTKSKTYDSIVLFQVLEHIWDISSFFKSAISVLNDSGQIILSVPNSNPYLNYFEKWDTLNFPPHHMGLWDKESLINVGLEFGLDVIKICHEPINDYGINVLINEYKIQKVVSVKHRIFSFLYKIPFGRRKKSIMRFCANLLFEGRNILVVFKNNSS